jgi:hypothetical protein
MSDSDNEPAYIQAKRHSETFCLKSHIISLVRRLKTNYSIIAYQSSSISSPRAFLCSIRCFIVRFASSSAADSFPAFAKERRRAWTSPTWLWRRKLFSNYTNNNEIKFRNICGQVGKRTHCPPLAFRIFIRNSSQSVSCC